jgi:SAM-dependent methyltransferase
VDEAFSDARLAALYDALNPWGAADAYYLGLVLTAGAALDVGCGTGELLCRARAAGHAGSLTGADPAAAMLALARAKRTDVEWLLADAAGVDAGRSYDVVTMTGHTFQVLLDDAATVAALRNLARHLAPGGLLAFETRNPSARAWEGWRPELTRTTVTAPDGEPYEVWFDVTEVRGDVVTFDGVFRSLRTGAATTSASTLRFPSYDTVARLLAEAGLAVRAAYGDWDRGPVTATSAELVVVAAPT